MISQSQTVSAAGHSDVLAALRTASRKTGLDFDYLLNTAMRESSLNVQAKSKVSSASGLFQFIDQTWLGVVKRYGERHGLGAYAGAIQQGGDGRYSVSSPETKAAILALRQNPELSAMMAGESAKEIKQSLECALGRKLCGGELYAAHFMGPSAARQLIQLNESDPAARADRVFPQAARANKTVFYDTDGRAKTIGEVYAAVVNPQGQAKTAPLPPPQLRLVAANDATARMAEGSTPVARLADTGKPDLPEAQDDESRPLFRSESIGMAARTMMDGELHPIPQAALVLTPDIVEILASLAPATLRRTA